MTEGKLQGDFHCHHCFVYEQVSREMNARKDITIMSYKVRLFSLLEAGGFCGSGQQRGRHIEKKPSL